MNIVGEQVYLFTKPEVKHVSEGLHRELLSPARVQQVRFTFFRNNVRVRRLIGLCQLPAYKGRSYRPNILWNDLAGLRSSDIGMEVFCWVATAAACLRFRGWLILKWYATVSL